MFLPKLSWLCWLFFFCFASKVCISQVKPHATTFFIYEDRTKKLSAPAALLLYRQGKFEPIAAGGYNKGFTRSIFWLIYKNDRQVLKDSLFVNIGHQHINRIDFYFVENDSLQLLGFTGDHYPFKQRLVEASDFFFPINQQGTYLARIDKVNESLQLSFKALARSDALKTENNRKIVMATFTGMVLLLLLFSLYLYIISADKVYLFYTLYIATGWLWVLANAGYGFQYLWPNQSWFASKARPVFALAPLIFSNLFLVRYIGGVKSPGILRVFKIINFSLVFCVLAILWFPKEGYQNNLWVYIQYLIPLLSTAYLLFVSFILIKSSLSGSKLALFYITAFFTLFVFSILQSIFSLGGYSVFEDFFTHFGLSVGFVAELSILTAGLVYRFNQYRIDREKLLLEINLRQIENTKMLMEVQQSERSQVANQLHDVVGSLLSAAKLNLSNLQEDRMQANAPSLVMLAKTEEAVSMLSEMVRNLSHALSPVMLEKVGFKTSLEKIIGIVNASGKINTQLVVIGFEKYDAALSLYYTGLYGIIYELLNNAVKHSAAKDVLIQVSEYPDCFLLIAEDNGVGMPSETPEKTNSMGLAGIRSKVNYFKGSIAFDQNLPQGLIVTIEIPLGDYEV